MTAPARLFPCVKCGSRLAERALRGLVRMSRATGAEIGPDGVSAFVKVQCPCGAGHYTLPLATRGGPLAWCYYTTGFHVTSDWLVEVDVAASTEARLATHVVRPPSESVAVYDPARAYLYRTDTGKLHSTAASKGASPSALRAERADLDPLDPLAPLRARVAEGRARAAREAAAGKALGPAALRDLARSLEERLARLAADPARNKPAETGQPARFAEPKVVATGGALRVTYRPSRAPLDLTVAEAERYEAALDGGFTGLHFELPPPPPPGEEDGALASPAAESASDGAAS